MEPSSEDDFFVDDIMMSLSREKFVGVERTEPQNPKEVFSTSSCSEEVSSHGVLPQILLENVNAEVVISDGIDILDIVGADIEVAETVKLIKTTKGVDDLFDDENVESQIVGDQALLLDDSSLGNDTDYKPAASEQNSSDSSSEEESEEVLLNNILTSSNQEVPVRNKRTRNCKAVPAD
ncbi:hypothetical protein J6590_072886 [Homalodisca vitripennis]|nr:hypothetical protein J6590_072886 [Homalodisca vitripennis]